MFKVKNTQLYLILFIVLIGLSVCGQAKADVISPYTFNNEFIDAIFAILINILIEGLIGYFILFRNILKKNKVILAIILGNIISYPLLIILIKIIQSLLVTTALPQLIGVSLILIAEFIIILLEACIYMSFLKSELSFKKAIGFSLILNISSFIIGYMFIRVFIGALLKKPFMPY